MRPISPVGLTRMGNVSRISSTNFCTTGAPPSSSLIASMTKSSAANFFDKASIDGISARHGGHQVAQKFRNTTFPRCADRRTACPWRSCATKSGAVLPPLWQPVLVSSSAIATSGASAARRLFAQNSPSVPSRTLPMPNHCASDSPSA